MQTLELVGFPTQCLCLQANTHISQHWITNCTFNSLCRLYLKSCTNLTNIVKYNSSMWTLSLFYSEFRAEKYLRSTFNHSQVIESKAELWVGQPLFKLCSDSLLLYEDDADNETNGTQHLLTRQTGYQTLKQVHSLSLASPFRFLVPHYHLISAHYLASHDISRKYLHGSK